MSHEKPSLSDCVHFWLREHIKTIDNAFISFPQYMDEEWNRTFNVIYVSHNDFRTKLFLNISLDYVSISWVIETRSSVSGMKRQNLMLQAKVECYEPDFFERIDKHIREWIRRNTDEDLQQVSDSQES